LSTREDFWSRKPKAKFCEDTGYDTDWYPQDEMDEWLDELRNTIKEWIEHYKPPEGSFNRLTQEPFKELEKIVNP